MSIAIIGAGIAGAACAAALSKQGKQLVVFDKGRQPGGRMTSKRIEQAYLDLGAQYFTARQPEFIRQCQLWLNEGVITRWQGSLAQYSTQGLKASPDDTLRYIGIPSMQSPVKHLLTKVEVKTQCQIDQLHYNGQVWQLRSQGKVLGDFKTLILAIPQQQAAALLGHLVNTSPQLQPVFATPALLPCWAVNVQSRQPLWPFDGIFFKNDSALSWAARQSSKPGRCNEGNWLLHFSTTFSTQWLEADNNTIAQLAQEELAQVCDMSQNVTVNQCHRWRYAQQNPDYVPQGALYVPELALGLAGDWLNGGRVENAWLSGTQLAQELQA